MSLSQNHFFSQKFNLQKPFFVFRVSTKCQSGLRWTIWVITHFPSSTFLSNFLLSFSRLKKTQKCHLSKKNASFCISNLANYFGNTFYPNFFWTITCWLNKIKVMSKMKCCQVSRPVFPNLFWFAAPLLSIEDIWLHP